ncbi:oligosaccharide flippase family protein [Francisella sp. LA112445]|uniref:oligosaccharide flippase family protein n=1 Tax=Francisella sp. LA112445 TaxID=1395624 RepID=UPI001788DEB5|nr:oligosaccharide flippase family protein [Francisella sp. LA112445]QIW09666.1 hypothetical protein FIP56_02830 [Francisella sp. LA112445]
MKNKIRNIFANDLLKKGLSDSKYYMIANLGSKALGFLVIPLLARNVSIEDFANYDLFLVISGFIQILVTLGIDSGIAILMAESKNDFLRLSFYYVSTLIISILFLLVLMLGVNSVFFFSDKFFSLNQQMWLLIGIYVLFCIITYHTFNFLRWQTKARSAAFLNLFTYISGAVIGVILLFFKKEVTSYIYGLIIGGFLGSLIALIISKEYIRAFKILDNSKVLLKDLFKLSLPFVPNYIGNNLMQMSDRVVILMFFGKYELGLYAALMRFAQIPQFILTTITGGFLPVMYNNYTSEKGVRLIRSLFHSYISLIPLLFLSCYFLSDYLILIFTGKKYLLSAYLLPIAVTSVLFVNGTQCGGFGFTVKRKTHIIAYVTFLSLIINFILSVILGLKIGLAGVILGTLVAGIIRTYIHMKYSEKLHHFGYSFKYLLFISILVLMLSYFSILGNL